MYIGMDVVCICVHKIGKYHWYEMPTRFFLLRLFFWMLVFGSCVLFVCDHISVLHCICLWYTYLFSVVSICGVCNWCLCVCALIFFCCSLFDIDKTVCWFNGNMTNKKKSITYAHKCSAWTGYSSWATQTMNSRLNNNSVCAVWVTFFASFSFEMRSDTSKSGTKKWTDSER